MGNKSSTATICVVPDKANAVSGLTVTGKVLSVDITCKTVRAAGTSAVVTVEKYFVR